MAHIEIRNGTLVLEMGPEDGAALCGGRHVFALGRLEGITVGPRRAPRARRGRAAHGTPDGVVCDGAPACVCDDRDAARRVLVEIADGTPRRVFIELAPPRAW